MWGSHDRWPVTRCLLGATGITHVLEFARSHHPEVLLVSQFVSSAPRLSLSNFMGTVIRTSEKVESESQHGQGCTEISRFVHLLLVQEKKSEIHQGENHSLGSWGVGATGKVSVQCPHFLRSHPQRAGSPAGDKTATPPTQTHLLRSPAEALAPTTS